jgi:menaquinone-dependent protoporphyrinogen IX oxidase
MDAQMESMKGGLEETLNSFVFKKNSETAQKVVEVINRENFRAASGGSTPMQEKRLDKIMESRPWKNDKISSDAAQRAVRRGG